MSENEVLGDPGSIFNNAVKNQRDLDLALKVKEADHRNIIKKTTDYYNNDSNLWNNTYRLNKKFYSHFHEKKEIEDHTFENKQEKIKKVDNVVHVRTIKNFRRYHKNTINEQKENLKLNRLLRQKDADQKIVEDSLPDKYLEKMNNIDKHEERKRIQNRTNVNNKFENQSLWENKEVLSQKHLEMYQTGSVLKKEKEGIEMIVDRIKKEHGEQQYQNKLSEANSNQTRQLFQKQRLENSKKLLNVNLPENSIYQEQNKNHDSLVFDYNKKLKDLDTSYKNNFSLKASFATNDNTTKKTVKNNREDQKKQKVQNRIHSEQLSKPIQLDRDSLKERSNRKSFKEVQLKLDLKGNDNDKKQTSFAKNKDCKNKLEIAADYILDRSGSNDIQTSIKKYDNYEPFQFEKLVKKDQKSNNFINSKEQKMHSYSEKSLTTEFMKKNTRVESPYYYYKAPFPMNQNEEPAFFPCGKINQNVHKKEFVRNVHSEYATKKSVDKLEMRPSTVNATFNTGTLKNKRTESAVNFKQFENRVSFSSDKDFYDIKLRNIKDFANSKRTLSATKEDQTMLTNKLTEGYKNRTAENFAKSIKVCENADFVNMISRDITQIKIEQENPYVITLKNNIDPSHFIPSKLNATNQTLRSLTANSINNTRITTAKSFVKKSKFPKYKVVDNFDTISKVDSKNCSIDCQESNTDNLNDARTTCDEIDNFTRVHQTCCQKDVQFSKGFPGVRFDTFMLHNQNAKDPMLNEQKAFKKDLLKTQKNLQEFNDRIIFQLFYKLVGLQ